MKRFCFVLSGGAGTRLWPYSRTEFPKQFLDILGTGQSLLEETCKRLEALGDLGIVTTQTLRSMTIGLLKKNQLEAQCLYEPQMKNTAPAILWAALDCYRKDPEAVVGIFPADHVVKDTEKFRASVRQAFEVAALGKIVTLGIEPRYPATAYGYIQVKNQESKDSLEVLRFIEKPSEEKALQLLETGNVFWNAGIFVFKAKIMLEAFKKFLPDFYSGFATLKSDNSNIAEIYKSLRSESIDYGVMEKLSAIECVPLASDWSDVGSWEEVARLSQSAGSIEVEGHGNFFKSLNPASSRMPAFLGVSDLMVIDTPDAILVTHKGLGQGVRKVVEKMKANSQIAGRVDRHTFEERPWGRFEVLRDEEKFKTKKITLNPGQRLSYQSHNHRAEHWIVIEGTARVTLNDKELDVPAGEHVFIPKNAKHRVANLSDRPLIFVEVQTGSYFGEEDITRYSDDYGR